MRGSGIPLRGNCCLATLWRQSSLIAKRPFCHKWQVNLHIALYCNFCIQINTSLRTSLRNYPNSQSRPDIIKDRWFPIGGGQSHWLFIATEYDTIDVISNIITPMLLRLQNSILCELPIILGSVIKMGNPYLYTEHALSSITQSPFIDHFHTAKQNNAHKMTIYQQNRETPRADSRYNSTTGLGPTH